MWLRLVKIQGALKCQGDDGRLWICFFSLCERKTNINYALRWFSCFHIFFEEKSIESRQDHAENKSIGPNLLSSSTSPGFTKKLRKFIYLFSASMFTHPHWAGVWCCVFASVIVGKIAVLVVVLLTRKMGWIGVCAHRTWPESQNKGDISELCVVVTQKRGRDHETHTINLFNANNEYNSYPFGAVSGPCNHKRNKFRNKQSHRAPTNDKPMWFNQFRHHIPVFRLIRQRVIEIACAIGHSV